MLRALPIQLAMAVLIIALAEPAGRTVRETPIQILEHGQENSWPSDASDWPEEAIASRIEKALEELAVASPGPGIAKSRTPGNSEIRIDRGCPAIEQSASSEGAHAQIRRLLEGYRNVRSVSFRITQIDVEPGDRKVHATVNYSVAGT